MDKHRNTSFLTFELNGKLQKGWDRKKKQIFTSGTLFKTNMKGIKYQCGIQLNWTQVSLPILNLNLTVYGSPEVNNSAWPLVALADFLVQFYERFKKYPLIKPLALIQVIRRYRGKTLSDPVAVFRFFTSLNKGIGQSLRQCLICLIINATACLCGKKKEYLKVSNEAMNQMRRTVSKTQKTPKLLTELSKMRDINAIEYFILDQHHPEMLGAQSFYDQPPSRIYETQEDIYNSQGQGREEMSDPGESMIDPFNEHNESILSEAAMEILHDLKADDPAKRNYQTTPNPNFAMRRKSYQPRKQKGSNRQIGGLFNRKVSHAPRIDGYQDNQQLFARGKFKKTQQMGMMVQPDQPFNQQSGFLKSPGYRASPKPGALEGEQINEGFHLVGSTAKFSATQPLNVVNRYGQVFDPTDSMNPMRQLQLGDGSFNSQFMDLSKKSQIKNYFMFDLGLESQMGPRVVNIPDAKKILDSCVTIRRKAPKNKPEEVSLKRLLKFHLRQVTDIAKLHSRMNLVASAKAIKQENYSVGLTDSLAKLIKRLKNTDQLYFFKFARIFFELYYTTQLVDQPQFQPENILYAVIDHFIRSPEFDEDLQGGFFNFGKFVHQWVLYGFRATHDFNAAKHYYSYAPITYLSNNKGSHLIRKLLENKNTFHNVHPTNFKFLLSQVYLFSDSPIEETVTFIQKQFNLPYFKKSPSEIAEFCLTISCAEIAQHKSIKSFKQLADSLKLSRQFFNSPGAVSHFVTQRIASCEKTFLESLSTRTSKKVTVVDLKASVLVLGCLTKQTLQRLLLEVSETNLDALVEQLEACCSLNSTQKIIPSQTSQDFLKEKIELESIRENLVAIILNEEKNFVNQVINLVEENQSYFPDVLEVMKKSLKTVVEEELKPQDDSINEYLLEVIRNGARKQVEKRLTLILNLSKGPSSNNNNETTSKREAKKLVKQLLDKAESCNLLLSGFKNLAKIFSEQGRASRHDFLARYCIKSGEEIKAIKKLLSKADERTLTYKNLIDFKNKKIPEFDSECFSEISDLLEYGEFAQSLVLTCLKKETMLKDLAQLRDLSVENEKKRLNNKLTPDKKFSELFKIFKNIFPELKTVFTPLSDPEKFKLRDYLTLKEIKGFNKMTSSTRRQILELIDLPSNSITNILDSISFFKMTQNRKKIKDMMDEVLQMHPQFILCPEDTNLMSLFTAISGEGLDAGDPEFSYKRYQHQIEEANLKEYIKELGDIVITFKNLVKCFEVYNEVKRSGGLKTILGMLQSEERKKFKLEQDDIQIIQALFCDVQKSLEDSNQGFIKFCDSLNLKIRAKDHNKEISALDYLTQGDFESKRQSISDLITETNNSDSTGLKVLSSVVSNCKYIFRVTKNTRSYELIVQVFDQEGKFSKELVQDDLKSLYNKLLSFKIIETENEQMKEVTERVKCFLSNYNHSITLLNYLREIYDEGFILDLGKAIRSSKVESEIEMNRSRPQSSFQVQEAFELTINLSESLNPAVSEESFKFVKNRVKDILDKSRQEYQEIIKNDEDRWILNLKGEQLRMVARYFLTKEEIKKVVNILKFAMENPDIEDANYETYNPELHPDVEEYEWNSIRLIKKFREVNSSEDDEKGELEDGESTEDDSEVQVKNIRNKCDFLVVKNNQYDYTTQYLVKNSTSFKFYNKCLFCSEKIRASDIRSFLRRAFYDKDKNQYAIFDAQRLSKELFDCLLIQFKEKFDPENVIENPVLNQEVQLQSSLKKSINVQVQQDFNKNILLVVNTEDGDQENEITRELRMLDNIFRECSLNSLGTKGLDKVEKKDYHLNYRNNWRQNVEVVSSTFGGFGKSTYIENRSKQAGTGNELVTLFLTAGMTEEALNQRLTTINPKLFSLTQAKKCDLRIKVDIFDGCEDEIYKLDQILYQIINCGRLSYTESYVFFDKVDKIYIELSSTHRAILEETLSVIKVYKDKMELNADREIYVFGTKNLKSMRFYTNFKEIDRDNFDLEIIREKVPNIDKIINYLRLYRSKKDSNGYNLVQSVKYNEVFDPKTHVLLEGRKYCKKVLPEDEKKKILFKIISKFLFPIPKTKKFQTLGFVSYYQILDFLKKFDFYLTKFENDPETLLKEQENEPRMEDPSEGDSPQKKDLPQDTVEKVFETRLKYFEGLLTVSLESSFLTTHRLRCEQFKATTESISSRFRAKLRADESSLGGVSQYLKQKIFNVSCCLTQPLFQSKIKKNKNNEEKNFKPFCEIHQLKYKEIGTKMTQVMAEEGFVTVKDTYAKMHLLALKAELNIPIMIVGQSGCGKTFLVKNTSQHILGHECEVKTLHNGFNEFDLKDWLSAQFERARKLPEGKKVWVVFDEINTAGCQCFLEELLVERKATFCSELQEIPENIVFVGIANPYYRLKKKDIQEREIGQDDDDVQRLGHNVNPLSDPLLSYAIDFQQLSPETEKKYIKAKVQVSRQLSNDKNKEYIESGFVDLIVDSITACQKIIRDIETMSSVSLRDIEKFIKLFLWFRKNKHSSEESLSFTLSLCYLLRISDKNKKKELVDTIKQIYRDKMNNPEGLDIEKTFNDHAQAIAEAASKKNGVFPHMIAINKSLRENIFAILVCMQLRIPIMLTGQPGTSKSIAVKIVENLLSQSRSQLEEPSELLEPYSKASFHYLWGSKSTTEHDILSTHEKVKADVKKRKDLSEKVLGMDDDSGGLIKRTNTCFVIEEIGQIQKAPGNPTKILHQILDKEESQGISFVVISNWKLDDSQMSRFITISRPDLDAEDLALTCVSTFSSIFTGGSRSTIDVKEEHKTVLRKLYDVLADEYVKLREREKNFFDKDDHPNFHGTRDFYSTIKYIIWNLKAEDFKIKDSRSESKRCLPLKLALYKLIYKAIDINFSGKEQKIDDKIKKSLKDSFEKSPIYNEKKETCAQVLKHLLWDSLTHEKFIDDNLKEKVNQNDFLKKPHPFQLISENLNSNMSRFLMLVTDGEYTTSLLIDKLREWHDCYKTPLLKKEEENNSEKEKNSKKNHFGSEFVVIENVETDEQVGKLIARMPIFMEMGGTVVLNRCDRAKSPLYDLFNQTNKKPGLPYTCSLMVKNTKNEHKVHKHFKLIILERRGSEGKRQKYKQLLPPYLNRFEKILVKDIDLLTKLTGRVFLQYQKFEEEMEVELRQDIMDSVKKVGGISSVLSNDLFVHNYSKNYKIGAVICNEDVESQLDLVNMNNVNQISAAQTPANNNPFAKKKSKKSKKSKEEMREGGRGDEKMDKKKIKEFKKVIAPTFSRNMMAFQYNQIEDDKDKKAKFKKAFKKEPNSKGLVSFLETQISASKDELHKSLVYTYTHSSDVQKILSAGKSRIMDTINLISAEKFLQDKRRSVIEKMLQDESKCILAIQFKNKVQWNNISEVKLLLEEIIEAENKKSKESGVEGRSKIKIKSIVFLAHYSNEDLKRNEEIEVPINFSDKDWRIVSIDKLDGFKSNLFLNLSAKRISTLFKKPKEEKDKKKNKKKSKKDKKDKKKSKKSKISKVEPIEVTLVGESELKPEAEIKELPKGEGLDLIKIIIPRSIARIMEDKALTKDQKKAYKDLINTFKTTTDSPAQSQEAPEPNSSPGDKLAQRVFEILIDSGYIKSTIQSIEKRSKQELSSKKNISQKRSIFDLIMKHKHHILIRYTHDFMDGIACLIERLIGREIDFIVKKINEAAPFKDRQIFNELHVDKQDEMILQWEKKLSKVKVSDDDLEKCSEVELGDDYFESTTSEISALFKKIKTSLEGKINLGNINWYRKLPQKIRYYLAEFVSKLDDIDFEQYHKRQVITKLILGGEIRFNDNAIKEVQNIIGELVRVYEDEEINEDPEKEDDESNSSNGSKPQGEEEQKDSARSGQNVFEDLSGGKNMEEEDSDSDEADHDDPDNEESDDDPDDEDDDPDDDPDDDDSEDDSDSDDDDENDKEDSKSQSSGSEDDQGGSEELKNSNTSTIKNLKFNEKYGKENPGRNILMSQDTYMNEIATFIAFGLFHKRELSILASFVHNDPKMTVDAEVIEKFKATLRADHNSKLPVEKIIMERLHYFVNCSNHSILNRNIDLLGRFENFFENYFARKYIKTSRLITKEETYQRCYVALIQSLRIVLPVMEMERKKTNKTEKEDRKKDKVVKIKGLNIKEKGLFIKKIHQLKNEIKKQMFKVDKAKKKPEELTPEALQTFLDFINESKYIDKDRKMEVTKIILRNLQYFEKGYDNIIEKSFSLIFDSLFESEAANEAVDEKILNQLTEQLNSRIEIDYQNFKISAGQDFFKPLTEKYNKQGVKIGGVTFKLLRLFGDHVFNTMNSAQNLDEENRKQVLIRDFLASVEPGKIRLVPNEDNDQLTILNLICKLGFMRWLIPKMTFKKIKENDDEDEETSFEREEDSEVSKNQRLLDQVIDSCFDQKNIPLAMFLIRLIRSNIGKIGVKKLKDYGFEKLALRFEEHFGEGEDLINENADEEDAESEESKSEASEDEEKDSEESQSEDNDDESKDSDSDDDDEDDDHEDVSISSDTDSQKPKKLKKRSAKIERDSEENSSVDDNTTEGDGLTTFTATTQLGNYDGEEEEEEQENEGEEEEEEDDVEGNAELTEDEKAKNKAYIKFEAGTLTEKDLKETPVFKDQELQELMLFRVTKQVDQETFLSCLEQDREHQASSQLIKKINTYTPVLRKIQEYLNLLIRFATNTTQLCSFFLTQEEAETLKIAEFLERCSEEQRNKFHWFFVSLSNLFFDQEKDDSKIQAILDNVKKFMEEEKGEARESLANVKRLKKEVAGLKKWKDAYNKLSIGEFLLKDISGDSGPQNSPTLIMRLIDLLFGFHNDFLNLSTEKAENQEDAEENEKKLKKDKKSKKKKKDKKEKKSKKKAEEKVSEAKKEISIKRSLEEYQDVTIVGIDQGLLEIFTKNSYASLEPFREQEIQLDIQNLIEEVSQMVFRDRIPYKSLSENYSEINFKPKSATPEGSSKDLTQDFKAWKKFVMLDEILKKESSRSEAARLEAQDKGYEDLSDQALVVVAMILESEKKQVINNIRNYLRAVINYSRKWLNIEIEGKLFDWKLEEKAKQLGLNEDLMNKLEDLSLNEIIIFEGALKAKLRGDFNAPAQFSMNGETESSAYYSGGSQLIGEKQSHQAFLFDSVANNPVGGIDEDSSEQGYHQQVKYHLGEEDDDVDEDFKKAENGGGDGSESSDSDDSDEGDED